MVIKLKSKDNKRHTEVDSQIEDMEKTIIRQELEIGDLNILIEELKEKNKTQQEHLTNEQEKVKYANELSQKNEIIKNQKLIIDQYRHSIVFPLYKITSSIGKTKIGWILQRILK